MKKRIALIFGGSGKEHEISCLGAKNLYSLIDKRLFSVLPIGISKSGEWFIYKGKGEISKKIFEQRRDLTPTWPARLDGKSGFLSGGRVIGVHAAFPLLHGDLGEDGVIQGALSAAGIPFVGCKTLAGALAADKITAKLIASHLGIPTVESLCKTVPCESDEELAMLADQAEERVGYPMFIKPSGLGSSIGASPVFSREGFYEAYTAASRLGDGRVLIEKFIQDRRELECAYMKTGKIPLIAPPAEVDTGGGFYSFEEKYSKNSHARLFEKADIDVKIAEKIVGYTARLAEFIGCTGLARVDFFLSGGKIYFNEINTMPGMTNSSLWLSIIERCGIPKTDAVTRLILSATK